MLTLRLHQARRCQRVVTPLLKPKSEMDTCPGPSKGYRATGAHKGQTDAQSRFFPKLERAHIFRRGLCSKPPALRLLPPAPPSIRPFFGGKRLQRFGLPFSRTCTHRAPAWAWACARLARKRDENMHGAKQEPRAQLLRPQQRLRSRYPFFHPKKWR